MGAREDGSTHDSIPISDSAHQTECSERRAFPRYRVDCPATITPLGGLGKIAGRMVDLSRGGCRLSTPERALMGILARVEVQFQLRGIAFRIVGVMAGTRTGKSFAIRFLDLPRRREEELAEVLAEVAAANLAAEGKPEVAPAASDASLVSVAPKAAKAAPVLAATVPRAAIGEEKAALAALPSGSSAAAAAPKTPVDRRTSNRHAVDTRANLILVKGAIRMGGQILNLSLGGCRLRTDERFNVGIYTRVEAEFYLHGLPFRVGGVSQAILDKNTIGIRFLDMSDRRRNQLAELMAEIAEAEAEAGGHAAERDHAAGEAAWPQDSAPVENL